MADLSETAEWEVGIRQIETTDPVLGGAPNAATGAGMTNIPHLQLAKRTAWLKAQVDQLILDLASANSGINTKANINSPSLSGNPTAPTPNIFDNDTSIATTQFVQRALGNFAGNVGYSANGVIPAENAGLRGVWTPLSSGALTLPPVSSVPNGASFYVAAGGAAVTISPNGADQIFGTNNVSLGSLSLSQGEDVTITRGGSGWALTAGSLRLGSYRDAVTLSGSVVLTAQDAGRCFVYGDTAAITITLPTVASTPFGGCFEFINTGTNNVTVQRSGTDQIDSGPSSVTSIVVPPYQSLRLVRASGSSLWHPVGITSAALAQPLAASLSGNGWQRLPSGLIIQWGTVTAPASAMTSSSVAVSFPLSFPNNAFIGLTSPNAQANTGSGGLPASGFTTLTLSGGTIVLDSLGFSAFNRTVPTSWVAVGN